MNRFTLALLGLTLVFVCSCASEKDKVAVREETLPATEEAETFQAPSREAVFVYNSRSSVSLNEITLRINSEPLLLSSGYVRLVGVVSGEKPQALVEVGGRGVVLGKGEKLDNYRVVGIINDSVVLERGGKNDK